jgi:hypothetical protein
MRKLLTTAFASLALATAFVGSASAGDTYFDDTPHLNNPALQDQMDRDAARFRPLHKDPLGALVSPGDQPEPANSVAIDNGEVDHQAARIMEEEATKTNNPNRY